MAKTLVVDSAEQHRIPFLRGILTRSLQEVGLGFEPAYDIASKIRDDISELEEITSNDLRDRVADHLEKQYTAELARRYRAAADAVQSTIIEGPDGQSRQFSRSQLGRILQTVGLNQDESVEFAQRLISHFRKRQVTSIESGHYHELIRRHLSQSAGKKVARRYEVWTQFARSDRPLLILIGGTAGCGKSTIATELANRLDIVRSVSTDMLREVMRILLPERIAPVLHESSFVAWKALPDPAHQHAETDALLAEGYSSQAHLVSLANEAVIQRAVREHVPLILEGVHVYPGMLEEIIFDDSVTVAMVMLAALKRKQLRRRISGRGGEAPKRRADRYLDNFDSIWGLQSYLLSEADRLNIPIISNDDKNITIQQIMRVIVQKLSESPKSEAVSD